MNVPGILVAEAPSLTRSPAWSSNGSVTVFTGGERVRAYGGLGPAHRRGQRNPAGSTTVLGGPTGWARSMLLPVNKPRGAGQMSALRSFRRGRGGRRLWM